jgi:hypothetical protein
MPDHAAPRLLCVEVYRGVPLSFMTEDAVAAFAALREVAPGRPDHDPHARAARPACTCPARPRATRSPPTAGTCSSTAAPDPDWADAVRERLAGTAPLAEVHAHLRATSGPFVLNLRSASDLFCYAVVDRPTLPAGWVEALTGWCAERGWTVSLQGRKVYAVPRPLTKSAAAREVLARTGARTLLAAGDSLLDADLLAAADHAVRPAHGELHDSGWTREGLVVTGASGGAAGAELLTRLRELALRSPAHA